MAVRSIIDIDFKDDSFKRFTAEWNKYQKALKDSPKEWAKVTDGIGKSRKEFDQLVKQQIAVQARSKLIAEAQKAAERQTRTWADRWHDMARTTTTVARNVTSITNSFLRWSLIGGAASGLLGIGGLFGLDRLAGGVAATRRSALGTGATYGERRSFGTNFGRLVDPNSFLESVAEARLDVTKRVGLIGAGLNGSQLNGTTGDVAVALLKQLKRIADQNDPAIYGQVIAARHLGQFVSATDLMRLRSTSGTEFEQLVRGYRGGRSEFGLDEKTAKAWQDFVTQMGRASQGIENTFVKGLAPLADPLIKVSVGFEKLVQTFLQSDTLKKWIDEAGKGFETLAQYVGTPEFEKTVRDLVTGLGNVGAALARFFGWFAGTAAGTATKPSDMYSAPSGNAPKTEGDKKFNGWMNYLLGKKAAVSSDPKEMEAYIRLAAAKRGINPDVAVRVAKSEGLYRYAGDDNSSFGPFQLHYGGVSRMPGMGGKGLGDEFTKYTGLDARDPRTIRDQIDFSLDRAKQGGWGPWHGWRGDAWAGIDRQAPAKVTVENNTGGSAVVTTNAVAQ